MTKEERVSKICAEIAHWMIKKEMKQAAQQSPVQLNLEDVARGFSLRGAEIKNCKTCIFAGEQDG